MRRGVPFTVGTMQRVRAAANAEGKITTVKARALLRYSEQRWLRLKNCEGCPPLIPNGRQPEIDAAALADFLRLRNYVETGLTLSEWASLTHHTRKYIRAQIRRRRAPGPIGYVRNTERYCHLAALAWWAADKAGEVQHYPPRVGPPTIPEDFIACDAPRARARFELMHECGHVTQKIKKAARRGTKRHSRHKR